MQSSSSSYCSVDTTPSGLSVSSVPILQTCLPKSLAEGDTGEVEESRYPRFWPLAVGGNPTEEQRETETMKRAREDTIPSKDGKEDKAPSVDTGGEKSPDEGGTTVDSKRCVVLPEVNPKRHYCVVYRSIALA